MFILCEVSKGLLLPYIFISFKKAGAIPSGTFFRLLGTIPLEYYCFIHFTWESSALMEEGMAEPGGRMKRV